MRAIAAGQSPQPRALATSAPARAATVPPPPPGFTLIEDDATPARAGHTGARGESRMQRLADDAKSVMGQRIADSGTPERAAMIGAILAPAAAITALPLAALYTNLGNRAFQRAAAASPAARLRARQLIENLTRAGAPAGGLAASTGD